MEGARSAEERGGTRSAAGAIGDLTPEQVMKRIKKLEQDMYKHARNLEFEEAAKIRDEIGELRKVGLGFAGRRAG
jgi:excinuclease ABC subunit B